MVDGCVVYSTAWHSQKFYALHKARVDSLCARGAGFGSHDNKPVELPYGCSAGSNFTSKTLYWSSSPYAPNSNKAWKVNFNNGNDNANNKNNNNYVRLVRSGE